MSSRGEARLRAGHLWVYRSDIVEAKASGGETVRVIGPRRRTVGYGLFSDRSLISLRMLTRGDIEADGTLIRTRLAAAIRFRESLAIDATAYRLVHGESDLLPSLVVDRYGDYLVVQALSQGTDRMLPALTSMLVELVSPVGILARNDPKVRALEGLDQTVEVLYGSIPESLVVREGPITYCVDLRHGQKTGLFLDQRENREAAARYARGRLLDGFTYDGGFALRLAGQCAEVEAIDISGDAIARVRANAHRNQIPHLQAREGNVFDELRRLERAGARYDTIVLDPPAFARSKVAVPHALAGYKEINLRAMRLLAPGGYLVTCSCSYNVDEAMFALTLQEASADSHTHLAVVEKRTQGRDHPVLVGVPETSYLKCFILRKVE